MKRRRCSRRGLTLLEVLLATAILVMAMSALAQLQDGGVRAALKAEIESEAFVLCQSEMDRLLAHAESIDATTAAVETAPDWTRRIRVHAAPVTGLTVVTVELFRSNGLLNANGRPAATLSRWIVASDGNSQSVVAGGQP